MGVHKSPSLANLTMISTAPLVSLWIFRASLLVAILLWRFGSIQAFSVAAFISIITDPDRTLLHLYTLFMSWGNDPRKFNPPAFLVNLTKPLQALFPFKQEGIHNLPTDGRFLLVGNHQNYAMDTVLLLVFVYIKTGHWIRPMSDRSHYNIPIFKHLIEILGAFEGSRTNCDLMMQEGCPLLVYPGGAFEVFKDERAEKYTLMWKDHAGFAKMAAKHNYTIIPFSSVGFEDMFQIWFSIPAYILYTILNDPRSKTEYIAYKATCDAARPVTSIPPAQSHSPGYVPPPYNDSRIPIYKPWTFSPQSNYLVFAEAVNTVCVDCEDSAAVFGLRDIVRSRVEECVERAKTIREADPDRLTSVWRLLSGMFVKS